MKSILTSVALVLLAVGTRLGAEVPAPVDVAYPGTVTLAVDAVDVDHRVFRVREEIPVQPGPLTLLYPQWLPGNHAPRGPIDKLAGLAFSAGGKPVAWSRDPVDVYAFHLDVPAGATQLVAEFQFLSPQDTAQGRVVMTPDIVHLQWNAVLLYPAGHYSKRVTFAPSVKLPAGWQFGTALETTGASAADGSVTFQPVSLETLVDSPLFAGRNFKRVDLDPGANLPVHIDIVADEARDLEIKPEQLKAHQNLVQQAYKLFGSQHFDHYDFLLAVSDKLSDIGTEHHRSSENGTEPDYFTGWDKQAAGRALLPHEFTHSWNGKFRRPTDLATPNFNVPMGDSLLWVYEGQTQYWGYVLAARSGLWSTEQARDALALVVSRYSDNRPGFGWRNVQDTTLDPVIAHRRPLPYRNYQMSEEYYSAGMLIWIAVDAKLRELTRDRRSLDDFARAFFGVDNGSWSVKTYTFDDVVSTLNSVAAYDWATFLRQRVEAHSPPLDGIAASGWKLAYLDKPSEYQKNAESVSKVVDHSPSIGINVSSKDGKIVDVRWNGPAFKAGVSPSGTLIAVDGREFTPERLRESMVAAKSGNVPIELLIKNGDTYRTYRVDYREGPKYPHLERIAGSPNYLDTVFAPRR
ncbi:MAG: M61 family metallopeptidase [Rhodanobacteraceae bacterium]